MHELFSEHIDILSQRYENALAANQGIDALLIHSGCQHLHYGDDQYQPFHGFGHFCQWLPINRPNQFLLIEPGKATGLFSGRSARTTGTIRR